MAVPISSLALPPDYSRIQRVGTLEELVARPFRDGVNAFVWERRLEGDFGAVLAQLGSGEGLETLDPGRLRALTLGPAGRTAAEVMLADLQALRAHELDPVLNCIHAYPRDEEPGPVVTDVFSFHADRAPVAASTYLCTYAGPASEGLRNEEACRRVDVPEVRAQLLAAYGGPDDAGFQRYLSDLYYDLHYAAAPAARAFSFGVGHLWRIAIDYPGCPVPPCIHRAPATRPGEARLLLIS